MALLGKRCTACGSLEDLTFDCIVARGSKHHSMEWSHRMSFYRAEAKDGNLQVLCNACNSRKRASEEVQLEHPELDPF